MMTNNRLTKVRTSASWLTVLLMVAALCTTAIKGLNWGLDFTGGVVTEVKTSQALSSADLANRLKVGLNTPVSVVAADEPGRWVIRHAIVDDESGTRTVAELLAPLEGGVQLLTSSIVGPQVGKDLAEQGLLAIFACLLAVLIYLSIRFEWRQASGALFALVHDVVLVLGVLALTQIEFNLTVLAALLAVIGYSLNDSIVIADRVRELLRLERSRSEPLETVTNRALKSTLSRTMLTSGTTLTTVAALWMMGGGALSGFSSTLFVGVVVGTWSSVTVGCWVPERLGLEARHYIPVPVSADP